MQLERKRKQRIEADKKAADYQSRESNKKSEAIKAREAARKTKSESTWKMKTNQADRKEREAQDASKEASRWLTKAAQYKKEEAALEQKAIRAEQSEAVAVERKRKREQQQAERRAASERSALESRISYTESAVGHVLQQIAKPKPEKLRVLMLGAASMGDLRIAREEKRIRAVVESALHRDQIDIQSRPAATSDDLLDGMMKFRPHVIHFSGHSDDDLIVFEDDQDEPHEGVVVSARAFARAIQATDQPPLLVLLNSCNSASQIDELVERVVPFAIGMADEISDGDAINYAAQFYAGVANGQSIAAAHELGKVRLDLDGLEGAELPQLAFAADVNPSTVVLVESLDPRPST